MPLKAVYAILALMASLLFPCGASALDGRGYLEVSGGYKTGDFGTPVRSDLYYISPVIGFVTTKWDVSMSAPYLFLQNSDKGQGMTSMESGLGDIFLHAGRVLMPEGESGLSLTGSLAVKAPTASEAKGLGTGEMDFGAFTTLSQRLGLSRLSLTGGYIKIGDTQQTDFNDLYLYGAGISRVFGGTELSASFEGRRAVMSGLKNPQEITIAFFHILNMNYAIKGGAFAGLNKGGPDFGTNFGVVRWF